MKNRAGRSLFGRVVVFLAILLAGFTSQADPTATQDIALRPGWNAVYLDVLPANPDLSAVFAGVDLDSVWVYRNNLGAADFIQEVTEETLSKAGWISWVPTNRVDSFQNDLFQVEVNRAYLVKFNGASPVTMTLTGRPTSRVRSWLPDSYNFRGFPIDPAIPPTFLNFFRYSSAHYSATTGLEAIYRLNASGQWQRVASSDLMARGEAYWVYCRGGSDYVAPFAAKPFTGDGFEFETFRDQVELSLRNMRTASINVTFKDLNAPTPNPLSYANRLADSTLAWPAMPSPWVRAVPAATTQNERISVRRADMTADLFETVVEITDGLGTRQLFPVTIQKADTGDAPIASLAKPGKKTAHDAPAVDHTGLWVGVATVNAVSEAHSGPLTTNISQGFTIQLETNEVSKAVTTNQIPHSVVRVSPSMAPTPTAGEFNLRLLIHVDQHGQPRLLKEVIEMWKDGVSTVDADGNSTVTTPGHQVLVTDDTLLGQFSGVSGRDGTPVGRRLSTAGFDFADNELPMSGTFAIGSTLAATISMSDAFARNPFKHKYHPDHKTGYDITRNIQLEFSAAPTNAPPGYNERVLIGVYRETVTGLHRTNIVASGTFQLNRIATTGTLNQ